MREGDKKRRFIDIDEGYRLLEFWGKQPYKLLVAGILRKGFKLGLTAKMRENRARIFHRMIIASLCCIVLGGCGYKTSPVYVEDNGSKEVTQKGSRS